MPTHQDETLHQRSARENQDYLRLCGSMTAEQVADLQLQLNNSLAREQALQQRLTAADEQIDLLSPRHTEQPEGKRERFEKWVMATKHPVYGFLDGRSLARGDERTGYADEYAQGLWVAYLAFGVEQPAPVAVVLPERYDMPHRDEFESADHYAAATGETKKWNECIDEVAKINTHTVSAGLLRRIVGHPLVLPIGPDQIAAIQELSQIGKLNN